MQSLESSFLEKEFSGTEADWNEKLLILWTCLLCMYVTFLPWKS